MVIGYSTFLAAHYIESMPRKPKDNDEYLEEYIKALHNIDEALGKVDSNEYDPDFLITNDEHE